MDSLFNPDTFLDTEVSEPLSTKPVVHPIGSYTAIVKDVKGRQVDGEKGKMSFLDVQLEIDGNQQIDDGSGRLIKDVTNRDKMLVTDSIMLDLTQSGHLDLREGMNYRIGRYREAFDQNDPGKPWKPRNFIGQVCKVEVSHRFDKNDSSITYTQIKSVEKIG